MNKFTLFLIILISALCSCSEEPDTPTVYNKLDAYIAHAAGGIDGHQYTNSLEALNNSIALEYKLIEIDLIETSDNHLVGAHDWTHYKKITGYPENLQTEDALTLTEFKSKKIKEKYTPIDAGKIREIFIKNPDLILVTDKTNNFELLLEEFPFNERLVVEIFSYNNYFKAIKAGIKNPLLYISGSDDDFEFIEDNDVRMISVHTSVIAKKKREFEGLYEQGVRIFVFSSNNAEFIKQHLGKSATAFYTDFWNIKLGKCENSTCVTY